MKHGNEALAEAYKAKLRADRDDPNWQREFEAWWEAHQDPEGDQAIYAALAKVQAQRMIKGV